MLNIHRKCNYESDRRTNRLQNRCSLVRGFFIHFFRHIPYKRAGKIMFLPKRFRRTGKQIAIKNYRLVSLLMIHVYRSFDDKNDDSTYPILNPITTLNPLFLHSMFPYKWITLARMPTFIKAQEIRLTNKHLEIQSGCHHRLLQNIIVNLIYLSIYLSRH